jgi:hypothetical protein
LADFLNLRGESTMTAKELGIDNGSQRKAIKGFHDGIVNLLTVFIQALLLEVEVRGQVSV